MGRFSGEGWNYEPGTYRCDQGWNDTSGKSWGCVNPAAGDSDQCDEHSEQERD